jgi:hypothetical protein
LADTSLFTRSRLHSVTRSLTHMLCSRSVIPFRWPLGPIQCPIVRYSPACAPRHPMSARPLQPCMCTAPSNVRQTATPPHVHTPIQCQTDRYSPACAQPHTMSDRPLQPCMCTGTAALCIITLELHQNIHSTDFKLSPCSECCMFSSG